MGRPSHYSPLIRRDLIRVLYLERRRRGIPMTKLVDEIIAEKLKDTEAWRLVEDTKQYQPTPGEP